MLALGGHAGLDGKHALKVFTRKNTAQVSALLGIAGVEHAVGQFCGHGVAVGGQTKESIKAVFAGNELALGAGALAAEVHGHAGNAFIALVEDAVVVHVLKGHAAEGAGGADGNVLLVGAFGGQGDDIAFGGAFHAFHHALGAFDGKGIIIRQGGAQTVSAGLGGQGEGIFAVGDARGNDVLTVQQFDQNAGHAFFIGALLTVGVFIVVHHHGQLYAFAQTDVHGGRMIVDIGKCPVVFHEAGLAYGGNKQAFIIDRRSKAIFAVSRGYVEGITAVLVGHGLLHGLPAILRGGFQLDRNARQQRFAAVANQVGIGIHIGAAAEGQLLRKGGNQQAQQQQTYSHKQGFLHQKATSGRGKKPHKLP